MSEGYQLALLDYGRGKYHVPADGDPGDDGWTQCGMRLNGSFSIKFEDEVAPEDICLLCRRKVVSKERSRPRHNQGGQGQ